METEARAFYDWGRWVVNCGHCLSAGMVKPRQAYWECLTPPKGCGRVTRIVWPDDPAAIAGSLADKPEPERHWNWPSDE
jgi:hypothetical protein